ncbi:LytR/AlgR family response regulator transcription factor [Hanstruepera marina]|uniref:LytR/AlgR family response regulator transcription factor n=1 Tax=Hanstruepera marina TaxID=2873265 RepID=UPI001CA61EF4|nr:LytTR family DNA-binding domain-containing protein [Hanstruepera marina]
MKVVIVEDELLSSRRLERMLTSLKCEVQVSLPSVGLAVEWLQNHTHPEILFLDIQLSDGMCFEIFNCVEVESAIIFTTAFSNYSLKAFNYKSISYLLKPINKQELQHAILKTRTFLKNKHEIEALKDIVTKQNFKDYKQSFFIKLGNKIKIINVTDVTCFYSFDNATYLYNGRGNYIVNYSLLNLNDLIDPSDFFQVSRKCIINRKKVVSYNRYNVNRLKVVLQNFNEFDVIVSRERVKAFKDWIEA